MVLVNWGPKNKGQVVQVAKKEKDNEKTVLGQAECGSGGGASMTTPYYVWPVRGGQ